MSNVYSSFFCFVLFLSLVASHLLFSSLSVYTIGSHTWPYVMGERFIPVYYLYFVTAYPFIYLSISPEGPEEAASGLIVVGAAD